MNWPHWIGGGGGERSIEDVADSFRDAVGRPILASTSYHSGRVERPSTKNLQYIVEPDSSIDVDDSDDAGLEFVSPPLPLNDLLSDLEKVKKWANRMGCYTNDSTGLHINVSVPGFDNQRLDYVKLALLLGDEHILEVFGRMGNTYCKSAMEVVKKRVQNNPDAAENLLNQMRGHLDQMATKAVHSGSTDKYTSINTKSGYVEFRSPGGDWLNKLSEGEEIQHSLLRFVVALDAAVKPELYREEYLKKLYKVLDIKSEKDPLSYFAKFAAGELPRAALKSFVRQAQLERGVKRGKETGPMWWRVYKEGKGAANGAVIEVVASSREEAIDTAAQEWGVFSNEYRRAMYAEPLRPYVAAKGPELNGRPSNPDGNYVIVNASTSEPAYRYMASDMTDAVLVLRQWITANPGTQWDFKRDPEMRLGQPGEQPSAPIPGSTLDLQRQTAFQPSDYDAALARARAADAAQQPASQQPGMGQWNGQWQVLVGGREVYRFGNIGNSQADANRIAAAWLRQNGQGVSGEGFEVYPVMT
jgi:hypothetical protein